MDTYTGLSPTAVIEDPMSDATGGLWVVIEPESAPGLPDDQLLMIPCSFNHRRVVTRQEVDELTLRRHDAHTTRGATP